MPVALRTNAAAAPSAKTRTREPKLLTVRYEHGPKKLAWTNKNAKVARQRGELENAVGGKLSYENQLIKLGDKKLQVGSDFRATLKDFKTTTEKYNANYWGYLTPRGNDGKYLSVSKATSAYYEGAAHPNGQVEYATLDTTTGKRARLSEVVTPEQHRAIFKAIKAELQKSARGAAQPYTWEDKELKSFVNNSFAVRTESGKRIINVGIPSWVHATSGTTADFRFAL